MSTITFNVNTLELHHSSTTKTGKVTSYTEYMVGLNDLEDIFNAPVKVSDVFLVNDVNEERVNHDEFLNRINRVMARLDDMV